MDYKKKPPFKGFSSRPSRPWYTIRRYREKCRPIPIRSWSNKKTIIRNEKSLEKNSNLLPFETKLPHQCSSPFVGDYRKIRKKGHSKSIQKKKAHRHTHLKYKENDHNRNNSPTIQRRTQHIIKLTPPSKILFPNQILEDEPNKEPRTIIDARSRRDSRQTSNHNRRADVASPWIGVTPLPKVCWHWDENSS